MGHQLKENLVKISKGVVIIGSPLLLIAILVYFILSVIKNTLYLFGLSGSELPFLDVLAVNLSIVFIEFYCVLLGFLTFIYVSIFCWRYYRRYHILEVKNTVINPLKLFLFYRIYNDTSNLILYVLKTFLYCILFYFIVLVPLKIIYDLILSIYPGFPARIVSFLFGERAGLDWSNVAILLLTLVIVYFEHKRYSIEFSEPIINLDVNILETKN
ncbi:MAG: hypothetical protein DRJ35_05850 [Thermoprotei archaeon]|nr:MAG: hypothetical protein DRJ35_05850 [Thermoprotei archaeon]